MRPEYCCFYLHQNLHLGWLRARQGANLDVVLADGRSLHPAANNVLYRWQGEEAGEAPLAALEQLRCHEPGLPGAAPPLEPLLAGLEPGQRYSVEEVAARALPPEAGGWQRAALFLALLRDNLRFRYSRGGFIPRSRTEIEERARREAEHRERQRWSDKARAWRETLEAGQRPNGDDPEAPVFIEQLIDLLARDKRSPYWPVLAKALELFHLHPLDLEARLKRWLEGAGAWPGWPAIWLRRGEVPQTFAPGLEEAAEALAARPLERDGRTDFTRWPAYSIDSPGTLDIDDAIAILDAGPDGLTIALHIAEPSALLGPGDALFEEAARRLSSAYTLAGTFPMFPERLSNDRFSLRQGELRETLSLTLRLSEGEARLLGVERGIVSLARNLDYDGGQTLLDEQPETWGRLAGLCASLTEERGRRGAIVQERRELVLDLSDPEHIAVTVVNRSGPVHQLIEELAILYNREAGEYCRRHALPGIYRVQPRARGNGRLWHDVAEPPMAARFSVQGDEHAGLACSRYIQTTSPIRRFPDLVMQRQIAGHAAEGRVVYRDEAQLAEWADRAEGRLSTYAEVARQIESYWKRRYLAQNRGLLLEGWARPRGEAGPDRVWLEPLALNAECALPPGLREGDRVRVRVESVDEARRSVWVTCLP